MVYEPTTHNWGNTTLYVQKNMHVYLLYIHPMNPCIPMAFHFTYCLILTPQLDCHNPQYLGQLPNVRVSHFNKLADPRP